MATYDNTTAANKAIVYTIVFTVDLTSPDAFSAPNVNGNQTHATLATQRSTWIPGKQRRENHVVHHGDSITAYDEYAYYLKANYVKSATNPNGILKVVTETP